jgi:tryptophan synthase alpha chain
VSAASPARLARAFAARRGHTSLIPFVTAGYPSPAGTLELLRGLAALPVLAIEIGIPFSDPIADGPEIQRSSERALAAGMGPRETLALVREFRASSQLPVVLMTYANPVLRIGAETFAAEAKDAGVDGLIVSDLPPDEAPATWDAFDQAGLDTVILIAPTTDPARLPVLLARCRGFVYCLARTGVTGAGGGESGSIGERVRAIRAACDLPVAIGFGITSADRARALDGTADALIVGAALMRAVREGIEEGGNGADGERRGIERALALAGAMGSALA